MNWKYKSVIQNLVSKLPSTASYEVYYWIQRHFGGLRKINPIFRLKAGMKTWQQIKNIGYEPLNKVFFEVGTGRVPIVPLSFWLMGAKQTVTIDLNPYLKPELIKEVVQYIVENQEEVQKLFGNLLQKDRMAKLVDFYKATPFSEEGFFDLCGIKYIAPGDAAQTKLKSKSIDFHTSFTVFEHIPFAELNSIISEGNRIISDKGLFVHCIDYSDHFWHSDKSISPINFLQFSDSEWDKYAGNRYMFLNRLRHDDYINMFESAGHAVLSVEPDVDQECKELLKSGTFKLAEQFKAKAEDVLSIKGAWIVSQNVN